jgi:mannose-6-phosphate isomerase-like protein (cupin superfamily)
MAPQVINFSEKFGKFAEPWSPRVIAEMNDYQFKLVRLKGDFVWHNHADTDEVFMVIAGSMQVGFRDREVTIRAGEMFTPPRASNTSPAPRRNARRCSSSRAGW